jgi:glycosyltransferase involved in cell wall biosynthesis
MKVALVHDYLKDFGGAERVLEALCEIYPGSPIYTAFYKEGSTAHKRFKKRKIITSWAQKVPFFASVLHSPLRFLAPLVWGSFDFSEFDVVVGSSSWYVTKGFKKGHKTVEVCYCHTPPRYLYGYTTSIDWKKNRLIRIYGVMVNHFMRVYDFEAAQRVDWFIANSKEVAGRIKKFYRRESTVIYPPVDVKKFAGFVSSFPPVSARSKKKSKGDHSESVDMRAVRSLSTAATREYFLVVSRLVASKNVDLVVEVCKKLDLPLKVVGTGKEMENLKAVAGDKSNIEILGEVNDDQLIGLYQNCRAVIFAASDEDFGLVPVEAMAAGRPVIALAEGGVKETVVDGKTGVYFDHATAESLGLAINSFVSLEKKGAFRHAAICRYAEKFSKERFKKEIKEFVESKVKKLESKVF